MTESKRGRPASTPDLDRVIEAISSGKYDDRILDVHEALQGRREVLQEHLRQRVREVFGPDADVVVGATVAAKQSDQDNPFIKKQEARSRDARSDDGYLPGPYKTNPDDNNSYRMAVDFENGMVSITDLFGGHEHSIPKAEWDSWSDTQPNIDEIDRQQITDPGEVPIDRRGPIIGGLSASQMGN